MVEHLPTMSRKVCAFLFPLLMIGVLVVVKLQSPELYWRIAATEDSYFEYLTTIMYFVAFGFALSMSTRFFRERQVGYARLYALFAFACLFIGFEEISWGQRLFDIQTPRALEVYNHQRELNLHNVAGRYMLHGAYIAVGAYGAFAFAVPWRLTRHNNGALRRLIIPNWWLMLYFLPVFLLYMYYDYLSPTLVERFGENWAWENGSGRDRFMIAKDQEPVEFIMSLGVALFAGVNRVRQTAGAFPPIGDGARSFMGSIPIDDQHSRFASRSGTVPSEIGAEGADGIGRELQKADTTSVREVNPC